MCEVELFLKFPALSTHHRWAFTNPALHRLHGQRRLEVSDCQWRFSASSFPQLTVPVHRYVYLGYRQPFGVNRFDDSKDEAPSESPLLSAGKDWALESLYLQHHLHIATPYMDRNAPSHTVAGRALTYRLPTFVRALLMDELTSHAVTPMLRQVMLYLHHTNFSVRSSPVMPVVLAFPFLHRSPGVPRL